MIYTSYFVKLKELEKHNIIPISICANIIKSWLRNMDSLWNGKRIMTMTII